MVYLRFSLLEYKAVLNRRIPADSCRNDLPQWWRHYYA